MKAPRLCSAHVVPGWGPCSERVDGAFYCAKHFAMWRERAKRLRERKRRRVQEQAA